MAKMPVNVLGISYSHGDSSACLIRRGVLVSAAEEERFVRIKHYALFPYKAAQYCLKHAGIGPKDVDVIAIARKPRNQWLRKAFLGFTHPAILQGHKKVEDAISLDEHLAVLSLRRTRRRFFEHHLAHMASARWLCSANDLALFSFDGLGDFVSAAYGQASGTEMKIRERVLFPHSVGYFYTALTQYLGFPHFGDEFKVMGLSSYGEPRYLDEMRELIRTRPGFDFELNLEAFPLLKRPMDFSVVKSQPVVKPFYNSQFLTQVIGVPPRKQSEPLQRVHWDLAKSVQARFEEVANHLLIAVHAATNQKKVAIGGGCAHNSVWVGKITTATPFQEVFVAPASGDAGIAVGAAVLAAGCPISVEGNHWALLGPTGNLIETRKASSSLNDREFADEKKLLHWLADELAHEKIIGIFHGRMEFGPRALGSRSIVCDPRSATMRDRLNARVKHRELFRPFAASVLEEFREEWFDNSFYSPTMEAVFQVAKSKQGKIPAVVHADQSCRIQSVDKATQPFFWGLIDAFRKVTGVPMLINTSFNDCEPVVCTEEDATRCFNQCEMDYLVINQTVYSRGSALSKSA